MADVILDRTINQFLEHGRFVRNWKAISAFIEIGRERNRLVHQDLGNFALEKTAQEIFDLYLEALRFVDDLPKFLAEGK